MAEPSPLSAGGAEARAQEGEAWAGLIERTVRALERGNKQWTAARRKDSLFRVLGGSRSDAQRLHQRMTQLVASWDSDGVADKPTEPAPLDAAVPHDTPATAAPTAGTLALDLQDPPLALHLPADSSTEAPGAAWPQVAADLGNTVLAALPRSEPRGREVADRLAALQARLRPEGPNGLAGDIAAACNEATRVLQHRHHLLTQLGALCHELTDGLADLAEDDSWVSGQCEVMRRELFDSEAGLTARGVRSVSELLGSTRERQVALRTQRTEAREVLKQSIHQMLHEIAALGEQTGGFSERMGGFAEAIDRAQSLDSLAGTVREMVGESRAVQARVGQTQARLAAEHERAGEMQARVVTLEEEIRRLSNEVSTDPLTQVANRRGLLRAFEAECAKAARATLDVVTPAESVPPMAVALIDIDNFKRLNDRLGHANGDEALKFLTRRVQQVLRPGDVLARYGGEEFVVLLPTTPLEEAQQALTRIQRTLSAELFMSDAQGQVFVTFSAGVSAYRTPERLEDALERADEALYEAKRTGKNRTCVA